MWCPDTLEAHGILFLNKKYLFPLHINTWLALRNYHFLECDCNIDGIVGCDEISGECNCNVGYVDTRCDQCDVLYFGFSNCTGKNETLNFSMKFVFHEQTKVMPNFKI